MQVAVPDTGVAIGLNTSPDEISPEIPQTGQFDGRSMKAGIMAGTLDRGIAVRAALKAGVLGVFIGIIPILGIVLTGTLAVFFYRRESKLVPPTALGARLGGAAAVVAFAINAAMITIRIFVFHAQQEYVDILARFSQTVGANAADPEFQAVLHYLLTPSGLAVTLFFGMIFALVLAAIGGALASLFLRPRNPQV